MNQRPFGAAGETVSEVGLGCWQIGGADWGAVSDEEALNTLRAAVESGITFFDTADVYGLGRSEELIGRFLKEASAKPFVATKLGRFPEPGWPDNFSAEAVRAHTEASLRRLGVEALDLTQLHCIPTETLRQGEVFDTLRALKQEGKIRRFGASVESMEEALICLEQEGLASLQIIFNIFRQKPIDTLFGPAKEKGVALIARLPVASGLLSGRYTKTTTFPETDHRNYNRDGQAFNVGETFAGLPFEMGVAFADEVRMRCPDGMSMTEMALRWCLDFDAISVVIPGARNAEQARQNAAVSSLPPLPADTHAELREFYESHVADNIRGPY
jgi:aryl-alcohol dehydrogenase-like predicted oxidoreductase